MRKIFTMLLLCLMGTAMSWAETEIVTVKEWDFTGKSSDTDLTFNASDTKTEQKTACQAASTPACCEGLYFQGKWKSYKSKENGIRNVDSGDRMIIVPDLKSGDVVTIACNTISAINTTPTTGTANSDNTAMSYTMASDGNFYFKIVKSGGKVDNIQVWPTINKITVTREVVAGTCENPKYTISGVAGTSRKFTLTCITANATIYYSDTELAAGADGWTEYTGEVTTDAIKIYTYAAAVGANSEVIDFNTGAGTALTLNTPVITLNSWSDDGNYTASISSDQSTLSLVPSTVTLYYSIDGGTPVAGSSATVPQGSVIKAYASSEGYTQSADAECVTAARPAVKEVWTQDYTNLVSGGTGTQSITISETEGGDFTVGSRKFYNITGYTDNKIEGLNENVGINTASYFYLRTYGNNSGILKNANNGGTTGYIGIRNLKPGQKIFIRTNSNALSAEEGCVLETGMSLISEYVFTATAEAASILFTHGVYNYVKSISVKSPYESVPVGDAGTSSYVTTDALDFSGVEGLTVLIATDEDESTITLTKVTKVPAGAAIIVKGEAGKSYEVPVGSHTTYSDNLENKLSGSATDSYTTTATDNVYALRASNGNFAPVAEGVTISPKKAYLKSAFVAGTAKRVVLADDDEEQATAIATVQTEETETATQYYNAAGQLVGSSYKGLVIGSNGKKYIRK